MPSRCYTAHSRIADIHTHLFFWTGRVTCCEKIMPTVHNPSISWISSSIRTSTVMYFSPSDSLYVLKQDCQKMSYILISSLDEKLKWTSHPLLEGCPVLTLQESIKFNTVISAQLIVSLSWIGNGNTCLHPLCRKTNISLHKKQPSEYANPHSILLTFLF